MYTLISITPEMGLFVLYSLCVNVANVSQCRICGCLNYVLFSLILLIVDLHKT